MINQPSSKCLNCNAELSGNFCANCGQKAALGRITFKETLYSFMSASFALEGPLLYTIKGLILRPGKVFREYFSGKRKTYYKPVAFFILMTAFYIILRTMINFDPLEGQVAMEPSNHDLPRSVIKTRQAARFMVAHINHIMFFLVFSIGIITKFFFWKKQNLAEYTAIGFYISGMYILFGIPLMFISKYTSFSTNQFQLILLAIYILFCVGSFFKKRSFRNVLAYFFTSILSILLYISLGFGFSLFIVLLKG